MSHDSEHLRSADEAAFRSRWRPFADAPGQAAADAAGDVFRRAVKLDPARLASTLARADGASRARLCHRLQRQIGNARVQRLLAASGRRPQGRAVQREGVTGAAPSSRFALSTPSLLGGGARGPSLGSEFQLQLDPQLAAQMEAMALVRRLLEPATVRSALSRAGPAPPPAPNPFAGPALPPPAPLVPRGAGPARPRPAGPGDLLEAFMALPAIESALTGLQDLAVERVRADFRRLSAGERVAAIAMTALIGGAALAGIASDPDARRFALSQLNGRTFTVPGVESLSIELNTEGDGVMVGMHLDVGALLPSSLGFRPSAPEPIGGPP